METATLGGGCFWCLEAAFEQLEGVGSVISGYCGGNLVDPTYELVCGGRSGHTEVVSVVFDPDVIDYRAVLEVFFALHDPTTLNRQGNDIGTQYRSVIYYHSQEQALIARQLIAELDALHIWDAPVVTEVSAMDRFYPAEDFHQQYFRKNPDQGYCSMVVSPKVAKFRRHFHSRLKPEFR